MNSVAGTISALAWNQTTGALSEIRGSPFDAQGASGGDIATLRGQYLYATDGNNLVSPNTDAIVGFTIDSSGALSPLAGSPFPRPACHYRAESKLHHYRSKARQAPSICKAGSIPLLLVSTCDRLVWLSRFSLPF